MVFVAQQWSGIICIGVQPQWMIWIVPEIIGMRFQPYRIPYRGRRSPEINVVVKIIAFQHGLEKHTQVYSFEVGAQIERRKVPGGVVSDYPNVAGVTNGRRAIID